MPARMGAAPKNFEAKLLCFPNIFPGETMEYSPFLGDASTPKNEKKTGGVFSGQS